MLHYRLQRRILQQTDVLSFLGAWVRLILWVRRKENIQNLKLIERNFVSKRNSVLAAKLPEIMNQ